MGNPTAAKQSSGRRGHALVVGLGGLGVPAAATLAGDTIAHLTLVDGDRIELSNLHRQVLYADADVGSCKATTLAKKLRRLYPDVRIDSVARHLDAHNAPELIRHADVVIDGVDDAHAKLLLNDLCVELGVPLCHAGAVGWRGQLFLILPHVTACLRCLFLDLPGDDDTPTCESAGILGPVCGILGTLQALTALRLIAANDARAMVSPLLLFDGKTTNLREIRTAADPACRVCGESGQTDRQ